MTMTEIEAKAAHLRAARNVLAADLSILNDALEAVKRQFMPRIKNGVNRLAARHTELHTALESSPELFESPRTQVFHGIKVGFRKGTGGIEWDDDERTSDLIKKHFPEQFDVLVKTTRKPQKKALGSLEVSDLKKVACRVESTGDVVVIKATDSEVDKAVNALLKGAVEEAQKEAA
jgi:hypothetical protein